MSEKQRFRIRSSIPEHCSRRSVLLSINRGEPPVVLGFHGPETEFANPKPNFVDLHHITQFLDQAFDHAQGSKPCQLQLSIKCSFVV